VPQGHFAACQKIGDSPFVSLPVGGQPVKANNLAKYVDLSVEDLRTGVQFPPPPPFEHPKKSSNILKPA